MVWEVKVQSGGFRVLLALGTRNDSLIYKVRRQNQLGEKWKVQRKLAVFKHSNLQLWTTCIVIELSIKLTMNDKYNRPTFNRIGKLLIWFKWDHHPIIWCPTCSGIDSQYHTALTVSSAHKQCDCWRACHTSMWHWLNTPSAAESVLAFSLKWREHKKLCQFDRNIVLFKRLRLQLFKWLRLTEWEIVSKTLETCIWTSLKLKVEASGEVYCIINCKQINGSLLKNINVFF